MTTLRLLALASALLLLAACNRPALLLDANADNLRTARQVAAAFYGEYGRTLDLKDEPFVTIGMEGGQGYSYDVAHNVLFVTPFSHADFDTQRIFAKACDGEHAAAAYDGLMFRFFAAHQLMHLVYDELPLAPAGEYEEELRINALTYLFLERHDLLGGNAFDVHLAVLEEQLAARFPGLASGRYAAATMPVDDNASYWYVTAVNLRTARAAAERTGSPGAYVASLEATEASAAATPVH